MIVKLGNWTSNPAVKKSVIACLPLKGQAVNPRHSCMIKKNKNTLASIGIDAGSILVEFLPDKKDYAEAHGKSFVKPHALQQMAREGWLIARPVDEADTEEVISWISSSVKKN